MSRQLFPFILFGTTEQETVASSIPEVAEQLKEVPTKGQVASRDFRPMSVNNRGDKPDNGAVPGEAPKASSATADAGSSPSESRVSLVDLEALRAAVEKASREQETSDLDGAETKMTGNNEPPVPASIPAPALLPTSSFQ